MAQANFEAADQYYVYYYGPGQMGDQYGQFWAPFYDEISTIEGNSSRDALDNFLKRFGSIYKNYTKFAVQKIGKRSGDGICAISPQPLVIFNAKYMEPEVRPHNYKVTRSIL